MTDLDARKSTGIRKTRRNGAVYFRECLSFNQALKENLRVRAMVTLAGFIHSHLSLSGGIEDGNVCLLAKLSRCSSQWVAVRMSQSVWFDLGATTVKDYDDGVIVVLPGLKESVDDCLQAEEILLEKER